MQFYLTILLFGIVLLSGVENIPTSDSEKEFTYVEIAPFKQNGIIPQKRDNRGCDTVFGMTTIQSCGPDGKCCDIHDECYRQHKCTASSWVVSASKIL